MYSSTGNGLIFLCMKVFVEVYELVYLTEPIDSTAISPFFL